MVICYLGMPVPNQITDNDNCSNSNFKKLTLSYWDNLGLFKPQPGWPLCDLIGLQSQALGAKVGYPARLKVS